MKPPVDIRGFKAHYLCIMLYISFCKKCLEYFEYQTTGLVNNHSLSSIVN